MAAYHITSVNRNNFPILKIPESLRKNAAITKTVKKVDGLFASAGPEFIQSATLAMIIATWYCYARVCPNTGFFLALIGALMALSSSLIASPLILSPLGKWDEQ